MALFDLTSAWMEGRHCPLASRDGKKENCRSSTGCSPTRPGGRVAVRVFPSNTGDPGAFTAIVDVVRKKFGLREMVVADDRGIITSARIRALNRLEDGTQRPDAYGWITALRAPAIRKLMADDGPLQLSLFDQQDLAEITSPDFPASGWSPAATRSWPPTAPGSAMTCSPPPRSCSLPSSPGSRPESSPAPDPSEWRSAR